MTKPLITTYQNLDPETTDKNGKETGGLVEAFIEWPYTYFGQGTHPATSRHRQEKAKKPTHRRQQSSSCNDLETLTVATRSEQEESVFSEFSQSAPSMPVSTSEEHTGSPVSTSHQGRFMTIFADEHTPTFSGDIPEVTTHLSHKTSKKAASNPEISRNRHRFMAIHADEHTHTFQGDIPEVPLSESHPASSGFLKLA